MSNQGANPLPTSVNFCMVIFHFGKISLYPLDELRVLRTSNWKKFWAKQARLEFNDEKKVLANCKSKVNGFRVKRLNRRKQQKKQLFVIWDETKTMTLRPQRKIEIEINHLENDEARWLDDTTSSPDIFTNLLLLNISSEFLQPTSQSQFKIGSINKNDR